MLFSSLFIWLNRMEGLEGSDNASARLSAGRVREAFYASFAMIENSFVEMKDPEFTFLILRK